MNDRLNLPVLFSQEQIGTRVAALAGEISAMSDLPDLALPVLVGGFVFAADLLRALDERGVSLPVEFLRLSRYGDSRVPLREPRIVMGPGERVRGLHVLIIDGVLDHGHTLDAARRIVLETGARAVTTAAVIDKRRSGAPLRADFAAFTGVPHFVVGYGMDDAGSLRSLPYIAAVEQA
ncbi:MAG TPA: phosphoribosyltransferase family protein [Rhizomicrobium sp.]|jgi:hypoxanthine phosphoribosyltransferase|nr:phosphoribosyltransferase family protein [Rhizomicrobium sp.]